MMKTFLYIAFAIVMSTAIISCGPDYTKEVEDINALQERLDGVEKTYSEMDLVKIEFALEAYGKNMDQIKNYYSPDSIDNNINALLDFYKGIKKGAKGFKSDYQAIGENIVFMKTQLGNLEQDLDNEVEVLEDNTKLSDSIALYIERETKNLEVLQKNIATLVYNYDYVLTVHDSVATTVQSVLLKNVE